MLEVSIPGRGCEDAWHEFGSCQNQLIGLLQETLSLNASETKAEGERVGSQQHWWKMRDQASHGRHPLAGTGSALLQWPVSALPKPCRRALAEGCAWWQVQDEPPPCPQGGELGFDMKPPAMPGRWKSGSWSPSRQHQNGLRQPERKKKGTEMCFQPFAAHL